MNEGESPVEYPAGTASALSIDVTNPDDLVERQEATRRVAAFIGAACIVGASVWWFAADPPGLVIAELYLVGLFSVGWGIGNWLKSR